MNLVEKLRKIEALITGTKNQGERQAAQLAKQRLQGKIVVQPLEYTVRLQNTWKKKLFVAICQKHQLKTYRYARQKYTTTMLRVSKQFMDEILWPEFNKYNSMLEELLNEIMQDLISQIHQVKEEDDVVISGELPISTEVESL